MTANQLITVTLCLFALVAAGISFYYAHKAKKAAQASAELRRRAREAIAETYDDIQAEQDRRILAEADDRLRRHQESWTRAVIPPAPAVRPPVPPAPPQRAYGENPPTRRAYDTAPSPSPAPHDYAAGWVHASSGGYASSSDCSSADSSSSSSGDSSSSCSSGD